MFSTRIGALECLLIYVFNYFLFWKYLLFRACLKSYTQITPNNYIVQSWDYAKLGNQTLKYAKTRVWSSILHFSC
jgi:hypothetical protein